MRIAPYLKQFAVIAAANAVLLSCIYPPAPQHAHAATNQRMPSSRVHFTNVNSDSIAETPITFYSDNWSGYIATGATFNAVNGSMKVPAVTCTASGAQALFWIGFDGYNDSTVEQDGIGVQCAGSSGRTPQYYAWWEMYPTDTIQTMPLKVAPGNEMALSVKYSSAVFSMRVQNVTHKTSYTKNASCAATLSCLRNSAEWIFERPTLSNGSFPPLADWQSSMVYSAMAGTSSTLQPISAFSFTPLDMTNDNGDILSGVNALSTNGKNFTVSWAAAQ